MTTEIFCFYLQNRLIQTSQTGGQWYNDTSPFSIPWLECLFIGMEEGSRLERVQELMPKNVHYLYLQGSLVQKYFTGQTL